MQRLPIRDSDGGDPEAKRRKVRKGTRSCWEVRRRRKIRCQYQSDDAPTCINCETRGTKCVSQEFADEQTPTPERRITQRLGRVEEMLEKLVEKIMPDSYSNRGVERATTPPDSVDDDNDTDPTEGSCPISRGKTPILALLGSLRENPKESTSCRPAGPPTPSTSHGENPRGASKCAQLAKTLYSLFPSQQEMDRFARSIGGAYAVLLFSCRHADIIDGQEEPLEILSRIPPPTAHPAVMAKRLMQLVCCIQQLESSDLTRTSVSGESPQSLMIKIVSVLSETVAYNDQLIGNVEGIETLALLSLFQCNAGNLRKAWLLLRRSISIAQLMGVDRCTGRPLVSADPQSDPRTRTKAKPLWFRLNFTDRYLSLMLGLPSCTDDNSFLARDDNDTPLDLLEKQHTIAAGAIIKRNATKGEVAFNNTQAIDYDLERVARQLDPSFWQVIEYKPPRDVHDLMSATSQMMQQMNHHSLLILLHLPYVLRDPKERRWDYSKTTCVSSSRQLLRLFLVFRQYNNLAVTCRHTDYGALTAAMTLLLGYLDPKMQARDPTTIARRDADRSLIIDVRDKLQEMSSKISDRLSRESATIITRLLPLLNLNSDSSSDVHGSGPAEPVRLELPFLGTININPVPASYVDVEPHALTAMPPDQGNMIPLPTDLVQRSASAHDYVDLTSASRFAHNAMPATTDWNAHQNQFGSIQGDGMEQLPQQTCSLMLPMDYNTTDFASDLPSMAPMMQFEWSQAQLAHPELAAEADQWTFQGFDTAYFESLFSSNIHNM
ncbi:hypothetical protein F5Y16DRAFT_418564 [Xylariaceae sp. FL0255]|nr:hypothetical protein F5Y16DRAFT_418564 [Xylariaceae sp. FL0255]